MAFLLAVNALAKLAKLVNVGQWNDVHRIATAVHTDESAQGSLRRHAPATSRLFKEFQESLREHAIKLPRFSACSCIGRPGPRPANTLPRRATTLSSANP